MHNFNNNHTIQGNLGQNAETRYTQGGDPVVAFSVGVNKEYTDKGGTTHKRTDWFNVEVWGPPTKFAGTLVKGTPVLVSGEGRTGTYTKDGVDFRTYTIRSNYIRKIDYTKAPSAADEAQGDDQTEDVATPF